MSEPNSIISQINLNVWYELFEKYNQVKCSSAENDRAFKAFTGAAPSVAEFIFQKYYQKNCLPNRTAVLLVLHFLKIMPTEDLARKSKI